MCLLMSSADTVWHIDLVKITMFEMVQSRLEAFTVPFDFAYTNAVGLGGDVQDTDTVTASIQVDSSTNYI